MAIKYYNGYLLNILVVINSLSVYLCIFLLILIVAIKLAQETDILLIQFVM